MLPVLLQTLKEQFLDVEAILAGLQHNILEPECLASLDQNYYVTVRTLYKRGLRIELDTLGDYCFIRNSTLFCRLQKVLEHKNYHEAYGLKSDPPLNKEEGLPDALDLDCDVDCVPAECDLVPPTAQVIPTVDKPESESEEELTEESVLQVNVL